MKIPIKILGKALTVLFKKFSSYLMLDTIYLSKLNIIKLQKTEQNTTNWIESKIIEKAKKEEINAKIAVKKMVTPILTYLIISNFGHLEIISKLTPAQKRKNLVNKLMSWKLFKIKFNLFS